MNSLLLLLLGLGGMFSATTMFGAAGTDDETGPDTSQDAVQLPPADEAVAPSVDIALVVYDWAADKSVIREIENGDSVDFGQASSSEFMIGAEIGGDETVGSVVFEVGGQSYTENVWRYTLSQDAGVTEGGSFEVTVTAYSGADGTGRELGSETFSFETLIEAPEVVEEDETGEVVEGDETVEEPQDETQDEAQDDGQQETGDEAQQEAGETEGEVGSQAAITLVVYDWSDPEARDKAVLHELDADGEIDLGTTFASDRMIGAEIDGADTIGSVVFEVGGETYIENNARYTLSQDAGVTEGGAFDIKVTVYSGPNGEGDVLATQSFQVETLIEAPEVVVVEEEASAPPQDEVENGSDTETDGSGSGDDGAGDDGETPDVVEPTAPDQSGDGGSGGSTDPIVIDGTVKAVAGRVTTLEPAGDDISSLEIVSGLDYGKVTVNPDNTFAVVLTLSDKTADQSFTYKATYTDGSVKTHKVNLDVVKGEQAAGWATGQSHYMLATDEDDRVEVETGDNHTKVYVTGSSKGLSLADIARMEGLSVDRIDGDWLEANGRYGQSEDLALDQQAGMELWREITPRNSVTSNHLLLERGYEYGDLGRVLEKGTYGEDELKPIYIGAWGEGDDPMITGKFRQDGDGTTNLVVQDIEFAEGLTFSIGGGNLLFDDISVTSGGSMVIMHQDSVTIRDSEFIDASRAAPKNGDTWDPMDDRKQALFGNFNDGMLIEGNFFDLNGWEVGYNENGTGPYQPPSMFSHNMYLGADNTDMTLRDTISMRASSFGANVRSGGFFEDNVLIDNNAGFNNRGGDYQGAGPVGEYALYTDNVITSGAYKDAEMIGGRAWGMRDSGEMSTLVDNIITHMADPNNPAELDYKTKSELSYFSDSAYYDDTIVYNWEGAENNQKDHPTEQNVEGLDKNVLDQTTIQLFTEQLLGKQGATITDLANYLRAQAEGEFDEVVDADLIIRFFQEGFGLAADIRTEAETLRFVPDDLGDGVRWDNRMNWTTEDLPGQVEGDSVDLGGNTVIFNGLGNAEIDEMEFGPGGRLELYGGKLTTTGALTTEEGGGEVFLTKAGQLWTDGHQGDGLDIEADGGRFVNTGALSDASLDADDAQAILATGGAIWGVSAGETLSIDGRSEAGFDDDDGGVALLSFEKGGTLHLDVADGKLGSIEEFRSGAFGDSPDVRSGIDLGDGSLKIDLAGLSAAEGTDLMLLDADEIIGAFDSADIAGLGSRNAKVVIDYVNDKVSLELSSGSGKVTFQTVGEQSDVSVGEQALWDALTAGQGVFDEAPPEIPEDEEEYLEAS